jgi:hypothetical protein
VPLGGGSRPKHPHQAAVLNKQASKESIGLVASREYERDNYSLSPSQGGPTSPSGHPPRNGQAIYKSYNHNAPGAMIGAQPGSSVGGSNRGSSGGGHNNVGYSNPANIRGTD